MEFARAQVKQKLFSINRICQLTGIAKATYYNHQRPDERFEAKHSHIKQLVEKVIKADSAYGIKRIKAALRDEYQVHIGRDALARLLRLWRLQLPRKIKKAKVGLIKQILISLADRTNLLIRTSITRPCQAITSDISEIFYNQGKSKAYLAVHKDVFGQIAYGWQLQETMEASLVLKSFEQALKRLKQLAGRLPKKLLCHQDQGSQYTSYEYVDKVLKSGLKLSYSSPGTPTENPGQESFFGRLKDECQDEIHELTNFAELSRFISKRMKYYNKRRIHTSIDYQTPEKFTKHFISQFSLTKHKKRFSFSRG